MYFFCGESDRTTCGACKRYAPTFHTTAFGSSTTFRKQAFCTSIRTSSSGAEPKYARRETFRSELSFDYNDFDLPLPNGRFTANLAILRLSYSFTPKITLDALVQYNEVDNQVGTNIRFSWLQLANAGLYLVYNEVDERGIGALPTGREFIVKYSYIFDVFN